MMKKIKILPISDIHGNDEILDYIEDNISTDDYDILTVSGDIWEGGSTAKKNKWITFQRNINKPIVAIQGNHDFCTSSVFDEEPNIHLLYNSTLELKGVKFFGTPNTVNFGSWAHMNDEGALLTLWNKSMPDDIDVMLSHGPPYGYGDNCNQPVYINNANSKLGSVSLKRIILEKNPKYVFCGHIHTGDRHTIMDNGTHIYNVSCLDESYQFMKFNPAPEVIEVEV